MAQNELHIDDVGTRFIATIKDGDDIIDVSDATTKQFIFKKPDDSELTKSTSFLTDGTDGKLYYDTIDGDFDQDGFWLLQGYIEINTSHWWTDIYKFYVKRNI